MASLSSSDPATKISASCLCGQLVASIQFTKSDLPIPLWLCSCDTCRYTSGHLAITSVYSHKKLIIEGEPVRYVTSTGPKGLTRCFCGICGTSVYEDSPDVNCTGLCGGALSETEGIVDLKGLIFVADTWDGGLRDWLPKLPAYEYDQESAEARRPALGKDPSDAAVASADKLHCQCHCGGVQFDISRPNEDSYKVHSPYGHAFIPTDKGNDMENTEDEKWWISSNRTRYRTSICACISCTKSSGYDLQSWAYIPKTNLLQTNGQPINFKSGTLRQYDSSDGVYRHFCGQCGATVFWRCDFRPGLIDVSVGIMRSASGSRAEDWLEWQRDKIGFVEFAGNKRLFGELEDGLRASRGQIESVLRA